MEYLDTDGNLADKQAKYCENEEFADHFNDWSDKIFVDYLENTVYAYEDLLKLLTEDLRKSLPSEPETLSQEQIDILYALAESQTDYFGEFTAWAFEQWEASYD